VTQITVSGRGFCAPTTASRYPELAAGAAALPVFPWAARAQAYPTRPVRFIASFAAGGPVDVVARIVAQFLVGQGDPGGQHQAGIVFCPPQPAKFALFEGNPGVIMSDKSAIQRIKELDQERATLFEQAKEEALRRAKEAVEDLNALGLNYRLISGTVPGEKSAGKRKAPQTGAPEGADKKRPARSP
jgi:hypothetical protein